MGRAHGEGALLRELQVPLAAGAVRRRVAVPVRLVVRVDCQDPDDMEPERYLDGRG